MGKSIPIPHWEQRKNPRVFSSTTPMPPKALDTTTPCVTSAASPGSQKSTRDNEKPNQTTNQLLYFSDNSHDLATQVANRVASALRISTSQLPVVKKEINNPRNTYGAFIVTLPYLRLRSTPKPRHVS